MALYKGQLGLAEAFAAPLVSDRADGLWPTVVVDERGVALGLVWSDLESLRAALERGQGVYHSRSRGLWVKGETSGAVQELLRIDADCDRDCLRFTVRQQPPGFCHRATRSCWGPDHGLGALARRLAARRQAAPPGSYTAKLFEDPALLGAKLREEARELAEAAEREHVIHEAADVLYFTFTTLARHGVDLAEVEAVLDRRALKVTRRD
jgi:phosphoribosyl-ATP pyrophosphohydrolase